MQIPKKLIEKWAVLKGSEDISKIAESLGMTGQNVRNAFKRKSCSTEVFTGIAKYYEEKERMIKQYI